MTKCDQFEEWFFHGPARRVFFDARTIVPLDTTQPQGAIQWEVPYYNGSQNNRAIFTFYTGEGYRDVDADSIDDLDVLEKLHDACCEYSGVEDYDMWIQETYPGYELYRACTTDTERERLKNFYKWARTSYEDALRVFGEDAFEAFYKINS